MIKNLVVSGCSFTNDYAGKTWPNYIQEHFAIDRLINLSFPGAGNYYISESIIQFLLESNLDVNETLVMVMWSGLVRKDVCVSKEFFDMLDHKYKETLSGQHYVFSGGRVGPWAMHSSPENILLKPLFDNIYKVSDEKSLAHESLSNIVKTQQFLEKYNYQHNFMSFVNYWQSVPDYLGRSDDFSMTFYNGTDPLLSQLNNNWIWADVDKNCIFEYAKKFNALCSDNFHPTELGQKLFAQDIIIPAIQGYFE
jgi:hypothetical protein